jgi:hypothetical protein
VFDLVTPARRQALEALVETEGEGWLLPRYAPPAWERSVREMWGVTDDRDVRWMLERLGPTPVGHFRDPVRLTDPAAEKVRHAYIRCRQFPNPRFDRHADMARQTPLWQYRELTASHHAPITNAERLAEVLLELTSADRP